MNGHIVKGSSVKGSLVQGGLIQVFRWSEGCSLGWQSSVQWGGDHVYTGIVVRCSAGVEVYRCTVVKC